MLLVILALELIALYFLSRWVTQRLYTFLILVFHARSVAVSLLLVLEFPGTVVHELAHLFTAEILGVKTGKLKLEPESIREDNIKSGSVQVAVTDPFRRYIIGLAPLFVGILVLTAISYFLPGLINSVFSASKEEALQGSPWYANPSLYFLILAGYLMFAVSNAMFSSPQDLAGFIPFAIALALFVGGAYFLGLRIALTGAVLEFVLRILTTLTKSLGVVLGVNAGLLLIISLLTHLMTRMFHIHIKQ